MLVSRDRLLAVICAALFFAGCDDAPQPKTEAAAPTNKPVVPKSQELPPEMVAAVSAGDSASAISMHFALRGLPAVSKAVPVDVALVPHREFISISAHFYGRDGVAVTAGDVMEPVTQSESGKPINHQLVLLPGKEGVYVVTASVETEGSEGTRTRVFSIPVIVAESSAAPPTASAGADAPAADPAAPPTTAD